VIDDIPEGTRVFVELVSGDALLGVALGFDEHALFIRDPDGVVWTLPWSEMRSVRVAPIVLH
jgi:hypothetical protein